MTPLSINWVIKPCPKLHRAPGCEIGTRLPTRSSLECGLGVPPGIDPPAPVCGERGRARSPRLSAPPSSASRTRPCRGPGGVALRLPGPCRRLPQGTQGPPPHSGTLRRPPGPDAQWQAAGRKLGLWSAAGRLGARVADRPAGRAGHENAAHHGGVRVFAAWPDPCDGVVDQFRGPCPLGFLSVPQVHAGVKKSRLLKSLSVSLERRSAGMMTWRCHEMPWHA